MMNTPYKGLGKQISQLGSGRDMVQLNCSIGEFSANKMTIHFDMFGVLMKYKIAGNVNSCLVKIKMRRN